MKFCFSVLLVLCHQLFRAFLGGSIGEVADLDAVLARDFYNIPVLRVRDTVVLDPHDIRVFDDLRAEVVDGCINEANVGQHWADGLEKGVMAAKDYCALSCLVGIADLFDSLFLDIIFPVEDQFPEVCKFPVFHAQSF